MGSMVQVHVIEIWIQDVGALLLHPVSQLKLQVAGFNVKSVLILHTLQGLMSFQGNWTHSNNLFNMGSTHNSTF